MNLKSELDYLAQSLLDFDSGQGSVARESIQFGPSTGIVEYFGNQRLAGEVAGAFNRAVNSRAGNFHIRVIFEEDNQHFRLGSLDSARKWINEQRPIPEELTGRFRVFFDRFQGIIYCLDTSSLNGIILLRREHLLDPRTLITPFRVLWGWVANKLLGGTILHGSAVSLGGKGLVFAGPSGSGKSTLAIRMMAEDGADMVSDDAVLAVGETIYPVFNRVKSDSGEIISFLEERGVRVIPPAKPDGKHFFSSEELNHKYCQESTLNGVYYTSIKRKSAVYPDVDGVFAQRLQSDSLRELFGGSQFDSEALDSLLTRIPLFRLHLGESQELNSSAIKKVMQLP